VTTGTVIRRAPRAFQAVTSGVPGEALVVGALSAGQARGSSGGDQMPLCGWCYADVSNDGTARKIIYATGLYAPVWVCADEAACQSRQDWMDIVNGVKPGRRTSWLQITARTPEGEVVL
jgi:hypothetical protein